MSARYFGHAALEPKVGDFIEARQYFEGDHLIPPRMCLEVVHVEEGGIRIAPVYRPTEVIHPENPAKLWDPGNFILSARPK